VCSSDLARVRFLAAKLASSPTPGPTYMDEWLKNAPALLYGNNTWLVVNKWYEPLSWTEDAAEAAWIMRCVLEREQTMKPREEKPALRVLRDRKPSRISARPTLRPVRLILPTRNLS